MKKLFLLFCIFMSLLVFIPRAFSQEQNPLLAEGVKQYQAENYEEAIELLIKARAQDPRSPLAAFFLGMAYKRAMDYNKALANLEDALKLKPAVKEALHEYIDILYQLDKIEEAKKWIAIGEKENIAPASMAFLQGLISFKEKNYKNAIASFEKAKQIDSNLAQSADYQIAMCYMGDNKLQKAKERFKATASYDPNSDLATYARQYLDAVENGLFYTRPLRITLGLFGGYDSNVVSKPTTESLAGGVGDPGSFVTMPSLRVEYVPRLEGPWLFNAMYSAAATLNANYVHSHDAFAQTMSVLPGYNFGRISISMLGSYTNYELRTDSDIFPDGNAGYKHYMDYFTGGPIVKIMLTQNQIFEVFLGYDKKNYYNQVFTIPANERDAEGLRTYLSWTWFYWNNGFLNLRYDFSRENTNGSYWDNKLSRLSASVTVPLLPYIYAQKFGPVYLQLTGSIAEQQYFYWQPYIDVDGSVKQDTRKDRIYTESASVNWEIAKNWSMILQYTHTKWDSNIPVYEYKRNQYMAGLEFRF